MAFDGYGYQTPYYPAPMPDNLAQYRQNMLFQQPPTVQGPRVMSPQMQGGVQWVNGESEAQGWMIAPNSAVALWDSSAPRVYLKQADASGKPRLTAYDLVERSETGPNSPQSQSVSYVTRKEFDELAATVREMKGKKKRHTEEDEDDE